MRKVIIIPVAIAVLVVAAFATANLYRVPTLHFPFDVERPSEVRTVEYVVDGIRCRGTSMGFVKMTAEVPGMVSVTTYARDNSAVVEYDPALTNPDRIREAFEALVEREGVRYQYFRMRSQRELD